MEITNIFELIKENYKYSDILAAESKEYPITGESKDAEKAWVDLWENSEKLKKIMKTNELKLEEKLQYFILKKRYDNLCAYLKNLQVKSNKREGGEPYEYDINGLPKLYFLYNDLKEINFIGTDMYANTLFIKNKVKYLYRRVDADNNGADADDNYYCKIEDILKTSCKQTGIGDKGKMKGKIFSYTRCFGKALFKYATFEENPRNNNNLNNKAQNKIIFEFRKNAVINAVLSEENAEPMSFQRYARNCSINIKEAEKNKSDGEKDDNKKENIENEIKEKNKIQYFSTDMSNARNNDNAILKQWIRDYFGEAEGNINTASPVMDAEVVCNFTGDKNILCDEVERAELSLNELCVLMYIYSKIYAAKIGYTDRFNDFIECSLKSLVKNKYYLDLGYEKKFRAFMSYDVEDLKTYAIETTINSNINMPETDFGKITEILETIDWENERWYMSRRKSAEKSADMHPSEINPYKEKNNVLTLVLWREILINALVGEYTGITYD